MLKRLVAALSVSVLAIVGLAPAASAATSTHRHVKVVKVIDWDAPTKAIDWDAPTKAIDWDAPSRAIDWD